MITSYNHASFLSEAIDSALSQTQPIREVIIVDDGSTDDTRKVANRYDQTRYVWQENQGLSAARNTGIRESASAFLIFLDADDRLSPGAIEAGLACFQKNPDCAFVFGRFRCFRDDGSAAKSPPAVTTPADPYLGFLQGNFVGMHATVMYRRTVLLEVGGFDTTLPACEDYDLYLRVARSHPVASHDTLVAEYRKHDTGMSNDSRFMLKTALSVLRRQRSSISSDITKAKAYKQGLRSWKSYYAQELIIDTSTQLQHREWWAAARNIGALQRDVPRELAAALWRSVLGKSIGVLPVGMRGLVPTRWARFIPAPAVGKVDLGDLRRLTPMSRQFGFDRGQPIDRFYVEKFLARNASDIKGRVLEMGNNEYTSAFGGNRVETSDVLHVHPGNPIATIVADLADADRMPSEMFDCVILTQTLHLIYDVNLAVETLFRILKPGGVLLATVPGTISQLEQGEWRSVWCWGFTPLSARRLMANVFTDSQVCVAAHGNVLASTAMLYGLAATELEPSELEYQDELYPLVVTIRATKPQKTGSFREG